MARYCRLCYQHTQLATDSIHISVKISSQSLKLISSYLHNFSVPKEVLLRLTTVFCEPISYVYVNHNFMFVSQQSGRIKVENRLQIWRTSFNLLPGFVNDTNCIAFKPKLSFIEPIVKKQTGAEMNTIKKTLVIDELCNID